MRTTLLSFTIYLSNVFICLAFFTDNHESDVLEHRSLGRRTAVDERSCEVEGPFLMEYLRRVSKWADNVVAAVDPHNLGPADWRHSRNLRDFQRIFDKRFTRHNQRIVHRVFLILRDETYRHERDNRWLGRGQLRIKCQWWNDYESDCDPYNEGWRPYSVQGTSSRTLLLVPFPLRFINRRVATNNSHNSVRPSFSLTDIYLEMK